MLRTLSLVILLGLPLPATAQERTWSETLGEWLDMADPWFAELATMMGDLTGWHAPEVLPNGDILIRRRTPEDQPSAPPSGEGSSDSPSSAPLEL